MRTAGQGAKSSSNAARAARILVTLGEAGPDGLSVSDLAEALGAARAPVHRALSALVDHGLAMQSGRRGKYHIGPALHAIAARPQAIGAVVDRLRPALMQIAAETGLSVFLMARAGFDSVCLDFQTGFATVTALFDGVGGRLPLGVGVGGQVILAGMDAASRERILAINAPRFADWGLNVKTVRAELAPCADQGWLEVSRRAGQGDGRVTSLAVPVRAAGLAELAVSVLAPGDQLPAALRARVLHACARHLPGNSPPAP